MSKKEYSRHEIEVSKPHDCGAQSRTCDKVGEWGFPRRYQYRVTISKDWKCRISRGLYVVNCKEGSMVALLSFSHRCVHSLENPGTWNAFASDGRRDFPLRETRITGPGRLGQRARLNWVTGNPYGK